MSFVDVIFLESGRKWWVLPSVFAHLLRKYKLETLSRDYVTRQYIFKLADERLESKHSD